MENNGGESSSPGASTKATGGDFFFENKGHVTDALRTILARLDASDLTLVYEKRMETSDRSKDQNRLLMSCKGERKRADFASIFTDAEMPLVHGPEPLKTEEDEEHDKNDDEQQGKQRSTVVHQGLAVEAYDCDGRMYKLNLKYLSSNTGYRIIGSEWKDFLEKNGLLVAGGGGVSVTTRKPSASRARRRQKKRRRSSYGEERPNATAGDIQMELWAFRSPKLSVGVKDQPGGALGLLLLHYRGRGGTEEGAAPREAEVVVVVQQPQPQQKSHGGMATEDMVAAATVVDDAAGKLAAPRSMPLRTLETLVAVWLCCNDRRGC